MADRARLIQIDSEYSFSIEHDCYTLFQEHTAKNKKTGEEYPTYEVCGYFYTLEQCVQAYIRELENIAVSDARGETIQAVMDNLSEMEKRLSERLLGVFKQKAEQEGIDWRRK